jgi:hypothetical protein
MPRQRHGRIEMIARMPSSFRHEMAEGGRNLRPGSGG